MAVTYGKVLYLLPSRLAANFIMTMRMIWQRDWHKNSIVISLWFCEMVLENTVWDNFKKSFVLQIASLIFQYKCKYVSDSVSPVWEDIPYKTGLSKCKKLVLCLAVRTKYLELPLHISCIQKCKTLEKDISGFS